MKTVGNGFVAGHRLAPFMPLGTPRLALIALTFDHAPAVFAYARDPEISRLVAWSRHENRRCLAPFRGAIDGRL